MSTLMNENKILHRKKRHRCTASCMKTFNDNKE